MAADDVSASITPQDRDLAIRTMIGEEGSPDGMAGVASTILNRATSGKYGGRSLSGVVLAPGQFEPWSSRPQDLLAIKPTDPRYQQAAQIFDGVVSGEIPDLTKGATHFYAPAAQKKLGRQPPTWGTGEPNAALGQTLFFAPNGPVKSAAPAVNAIAAATNAKKKVAPDYTLGSSNEGSIPSANEIASNNFNPDPKDTSQGTATPMEVGAPSAPSGVAMGKGAAVADITQDPRLQGLLKPLPGAPTAASPAGASMASLENDPRLAGILKPLPATSDDADFMKDFPGASAMKSAGSNTGPSSPVDDSFLRDFPGASAASKASRPAPSAPTSVMSDPGGGLEFANALPVVGPLVTKAGAAVDAALSPVAGYLGGAVPAIPGANFSERYSNAIASNEAARQSFVGQHPYGAMATDAAAGVAGMAPAMAAAPAAFGISEAPLFVNMLASGASGSAVNALDSGVRNGFTKNNLLAAGATGFGLGLAGPVIGKGIGLGANSISSAVTGASPAASRVAGYLADLGLSPEDIRTELARLGPAATIADVNPALTLKAQALAAKGGAPTSILKNAFTARAGDADNRVGQAIDAALGPKPDLTATEDQIYQKAQLAASPFYNAARANPTPMDVTPILDEIESRLDAGAVGGTKANLQRIKGFLTDSTASIPGPDGTLQTMIVPKSDPQSLLAVRQELDDMIQKAGQNPDTTGAKNAVGALNDMRGRIDDVLKTDPNIKAGDAAFSQQMRIKDALGQGTDLFTKGVRLEDFNRALASATPDEIEAMRQGARVAIGDAFENARQGQLSAARSMFGKSTANRAKLDALFPNSGDVFDKIAAEQTLRNTENLVTSGAKTAETREALKEWDVPQAAGMGSMFPALAGYAMAGDMGAAGASLGGSVLRSAKNALTEASRNRLMGGLAKGYAATGPEQADFLGQVSRAYGAAPVGAVIGKQGNVASNLLARTAAQRYQKGVPRNLLQGANP